MTAALCLQTACWQLPNVIPQAVNQHPRLTGDYLASYTRLNPLRHSPASTFRAGRSSCYKRDVKHSACSLMALLGSYHGEGKWLTACYCVWRCVLLRIRNVNILQVLYAKPSLQILHEHELWNSLQSGTWMQYTQTIHSIDFSRHGFHFYCQLPFSLYNKIFCDY